MPVRACGEMPPAAQFSNIPLDSEAERQNGSILSTAAQETFSQASLSFRKCMRHFNQRGIKNMTRPVQRKQHRNPGYEDQTFKIYAKNLQPLPFGHKLLNVQLHSYWS